MIRGREDYPLKKKPQKNFRRFLPVVITFLVIALALVVIAISVKKDIYGCGDGTIEGKCSLRKPYFCENGVLTEKASLCGCENITAKKGEFCLSKYQQLPKNIQLKYLLRNEEKEINFTVYKNMTNYLFSLPLYLNSQQFSRRDFIMRDLNEKEQRQLLLPLVTKIQNTARDKTEQARIAINLVQEISYGNTNKTVLFGKDAINYSRYPYDVLYDKEGVCGEKSELMAFLLRELGYGVVIFYFSSENHEAVGVKCPNEYSYRSTGYCFVETTGNAIISDYEIRYSRIGRLSSDPEVIFVSSGDSLGDNLYEYDDAIKLMNMRNSIENNGGLNVLQDVQYKELQKKYGLQEVYNV